MKEKGNKATERNKSNLNTEQKILELILRLSGTNFMNEKIYTFEQKGTNR
jgi:hypothetical protein